MSPEPFASPFEAADHALDRVVGPAPGVDADAFEELGWRVLRDPIFATYPVVAEAYRKAMGPEGYTLRGIACFLDVLEPAIRALRKSARAETRARLDAYATLLAPLRAAAPAAQASGGGS
jgi:hypothetical protein